jgi:hypothetical protein
MINTKISDRNTEYQKVTSSRYRSSSAHRNAANYAPRHPAWR